MKNAATPSHPACPRPRRKPATRTAVACLPLLVLSCGPWQAVAADAGATAPPAVPYRVPDKPWDDRLGHHRAAIDVAAAADAVAVSVPWRRRDDPAPKRLIVTGPDGQELRNILRCRLERESADLVFGPAPGPGLYHLYFRPFPVQPGSGNYHQPYLGPETPPEQAWLQRNGLGEATPAPASLPRAKILAFEARTPFDDPSPMGVPLTAAETAALLDNHPQPYLLFAEDRTAPIRMRDALPLRWRDGERTSFAGAAARNEYYVFQIGVFAARQDLRELALAFGPLDGPAGRLPAEALHCFNLRGIDPYGTPFAKRLDLPQGKIQALWIGIDIPRDARPGTYRGKVTVSAANAPARTVDLQLQIDTNLLADRGDADLWRLARLRWIDSTRGTTDEPIPPYGPLHVDGRTVECLGRTVRIGDDGLPAAIRSGTTEILARPLRWVADTADGPLALAPAGCEIVHRSAGSVGWRAATQGGGLRAELAATMEFDGHLRCRLSLHPQRTLQLTDLRLELPFRRETAQYMMGMGLPGGKMPPSHDWQWGGPQDSFWIGTPSGGLHCELRGGSYHGPMLNLYHPAPPPAWHNQGHGGLRVRDDGRAVTASAFSGPRTLQPGTPLEFEFALLVTPVKPLDPARQFTERYFHSPTPGEADVAAGIKVINVHHANELNPFINYPFIANDRLKAFVDRWHARGLKVKIYYTLRELTNHLPELWFLRSLGDEVLAPGPGGGFPWLQEHLGNDYRPQWYHRFDDGTVCAALANSGETRWYNFYVEGLAWLMENTGIDGLYLDDVSYDRRTLKRMRRVMVAANPDCRIDLHSNTAFSIGPATQYAEFFPYVDKLWFGESFRYDEMSPDQWLVQASGIPFGLMGDMLQDGGNRWLGMVYGMTTRRPWTAASGPKDPGPVWKLWDQFGIATARMIGYWDPSCPVRTGRDDVLATAYVKPGGTLVALGSWAPAETEVRLAIDWRALGIDPATAVLHAPPVRDFQPETRWQAGAPIRVRPRQGWLIHIASARP